MRAACIAVLAAGLGALLGGGCSDEGALRPNQPPQTFLMIEGEGELAPTHYRQVLSWHGEDADGEVTRFEYKWTLAEGADPAGFDTTWVGLVPPFVTQTRDTFYLPVVTDSAAQLSHRFQVRAVDDEGAADASPAAALIPVYNQAPRLVAVSGDNDTTGVLALPDTLLPVVSLRFRVYDPDNPAADDIVYDHEAASAYVREIRFWLEDSQDYLSVPGADTLLVLLPEDFAGGLDSTRQFHLQAVDRGGARSNVLSATSYLRDIGQARILVLDSAVTPSGPNLSKADPFWHDSIPSRFGSREPFYYHALGPGQDLGAPSVLHLIFSLFEAVVWYNGTDGEARNNYTGEPCYELRRAEEGLRAYLEAGGKVLLTGYNAIGASVNAISGGSLSAGFEAEVLLSDSLYVHNTNTPDHQETSNWWFFPPGRPLLGFASAGTDTLSAFPAPLGKGIDRMALDPAALAAGRIQELYRLRGQDVYPPSLFDGAAGVRRRFESGGELVLLTFPISLLDGRGNNVDQVMGFFEGFGIVP